MGARAIIAGDGALPGLLAAAGPALTVRLQGMPGGTAGADIVARLERLGQLFNDLRAAGVTELCFAGAMRRMPVDTGLLDPETQALLPRLTAAMGQGDDALLRDIVAIFEAEGFAVRGAHELRPDLVAPAGAIHGAARPDGDAARARAVLAALGPLDVGQAAVAGQGQMLGIETLQGSDAMLRFVADTAPGSRGVLVKRAKPGQDLRVDMPAIGPDTVALAAAAGLSGIELQAGHVLLLDPAALGAACAAHGLDLWAVP
ncbi:LpxI family protein [Roseicyclus persicicus]|uniref:LpxI family protein n=1 Tax=Roseicyclus persicicus TaxID=2650661 RepID=A0A7X6JZX0_9RHOB|nr:UDP-2,3-diacylglucosamine diphosphatase LpxI [Roseibacterium persicicum]NKX46004.1 LpxI family protein [Roseibacterium persicicum]